ncbi:MAG: BMP family ABC transporter substrate-binding protein [Candidatus Asgardarchaeia archaeon]
MQSNMKILVVAIIAFIVGAGLSYVLLLETGTTTYAQGKTIKAAFAYSGTPGDYGWFYAHDRGRKIVAEKYLWLEADAIENIPIGEAYSYFENLAHQGYNVIFADEYGFMDDTLQAAKNFPDVMFFHCEGYKRWKNLGTFYADDYQVFYLEGLMAGALTKTNHIGYIAPILIPPVYLRINAFALGAQAVNPNVTVHVRVLNTWYDPARARDATEALVEQDNADVIGSIEDSPTEIIYAQELYQTSNGTRRVYTFSHTSPMYEYGPDVVVSGNLVHWEVLYEDILTKIYSGTYNTTNLENVDYWWMLKEGAVSMGADYDMPINPKFIDDLQAVTVSDSLLGNISVYDLVMMRLAQMSDERVIFDPFIGPIYAANGTMVLRPGEWADYTFIWSMNFYVKGVVAPNV